MKTPLVSYLIGGLVFALALGCSYSLWQIITLKQTLSTLVAERDTLIATNSEVTRTLEAERETASSTMTELAYKITLTEEQLRETDRELRREEDKNSEFEDQIKKLAGTVGVLDKLAKTDKELLQKYSKVYFLNENYVPERLKQIDQKYILPGKKDQYFHTSALPFLLDMINEANDDRIDLKIVSAYRSFDEQNELKGQFSQVYGTGANTFSADQGFSEHQLGTTVDITDPATGGSFASFAKTEAYTWLEKNAYKYGFVLSYPANNTFYVFEPWHWRFVGEDMARDLRSADKHFYDWEQRKIDEYLVNIFD